MTPILQEGDLLFRIDGKEQYTRTKAYKVYRHLGGLLVVDRDDGQPIRVTNDRAGTVLALGWEIMTSQMAMAAADEQGMAAFFAAHPEKAPAPPPAKAAMPAQALGGTGWYHGAGRRLPPFYGA